MNRPVRPSAFPPTRRSRAPRRHRAAALGTLLLALACAPDGEAPIAGPTLPRPDLGQMEPAARRQIEERRRRLDILAANAATDPTQLGAAAGELGLLYHAYGLEEAAAACYREAERLDPAERRWPYSLGFLLQVRGDAGAAEAFERARRLAPDDAATLIRLARARLTAGEPAAAEELFRRSLARHPATAAAAQAGLAEIAAARGDHAAAAERYEAALALQPAATRLHYPLGLAYRELGRTAEAEEHLARRGDAPVAFPDPLAAALDREATGAALHVNRAGIALAEGRTREALHEYRLAVAADPDNATARSELGMLLAAGGDLAGARSELETARRLEPENPAHLEGLARVLATGGDEESALPLFRQAVELDPGRAAGHLQLAAALARAGRTAEALTTFGRALELDPGSAAGRIGRAEVLLELDRPEEAVADLEAALGAVPGNARALLRLGESRQRLGETGAALAAFEEALAGDLEPAERSAALLGAGNVLAAGGDLEAAAGRYREALALDPALDQAEFNLAGVLALLGRHEEALERYGALLARDPGNAPARAYRAELLLGQGRSGEALAEFEAALALRPTLAGAHLGAAAARARLGRWREARQRLEAALERLPGEARLMAALARLLASGPEPAVRDGVRALALAEELMAADGSAANAEILAMALAAAGRYREAAEWQRGLLEGARAAGAPAAALARLRANLALYESGSPCCAAP